MPKVSRQEPQDITGWLDSGEYHDSYQVAVDGNGNLVLDTDGSGNYYTSGHRISNSLSLDSIKDVDDSDITWQETLATDTNLNVLTYINEKDSLDYWSLECEGVGRVDLPDSMFGGLFDGSNAFSLSFRVTTNSYAASQDPGDAQTLFSPRNEHTFFVNIGDSAPVDEFSMRCNFVDSGWTTILSSGVINKNQEYHLIITYDPSNGWYMYLDNSQVDSSSMTEGINTSSLTSMLGGYGDTDGRFWDGKVIDARVYDKILSSSERDTLYNDRYVELGDEFAWWPINEGSGSTAYDSSSSSNDGTIYDAIWIAWVDWQEATKDNPIPQISTGDDLSGKYLWVKQELTTSDVSSTPTLESVSYKAIENVAIAVPFARVSIFPHTVYALYPINIAIPTAYVQVGSFYTEARASISVPRADLSIAAREVIKIIVRIINRKAIYSFSVVSKDINTIYSLRPLVDSDITAIYHVFESVINDLEAKYSLALSDDIKSKYDIELGVEKDVNALHSLNTSAIKDLEVNYAFDVGNLISSDIRTIYHLIEQKTIITTPDFTLRISED